MEVLPVDNNVKSCGCNGNSRRRNADAIGCNALKKRFQQIEFALTEAVLYLDAYPECNEALGFYHTLLEEREQLLSAINAQCGPMTHYGNVSREEWSWVNSPWPWNYDAN